MRYRIVLAACLTVALARPAAPRTEFTVGGGGIPWQELLSGNEAGVFLVLDADGNVLRTVPVTATPRHEVLALVDPGAVGRVVLIDFDAVPGGMRPLFIEPGVNLALTDPEGPPSAIPLVHTGGGVNTTDACTASGQEAILVKKQFDGDVTTAHFRVFTVDQNTATAIIPGLTGSGWKGAVVMKFGATAVPINRIRFYPRLGRVEDAFLIEQLAELGPGSEQFGESSFVDNFIGGYEIKVADNQARFAEDPCDLVSIRAGRPWVSTSNAQLETLAEVPENLDPVVDLRFNTRSVRWLTFRALPLSDWELAELEVYGEGFVEETLYRTQILDFGSTVNWGRIRWIGEAPEGTRVEIRTRSGNSPDPNLYFAQNTNGDLRQITIDQYEDIDPTGRRPTRPDVDNWSFWSPPYDFRAGLRDETVTAAAWADGTPVLSPGPSRYLQVEIRMFSTFRQAPRLEQLQVQLGEVPLAAEVVGEIWPIEVESFSPTPFNYVVRPVFEDQHLGFDRLEILTHAPVTGVSALIVDGQPVDLSQQAPEVLSDRVILSFPELRGAADSFKQIEVEFEVPVLRYGSEFSSWVFNSQDPDRIRQQVRAGNATFRFSGNVLAVATPLQGSLLVDLEPSSRVITPNGDGVNDAFVLAFKLRQLTLARPVQLQIFDLSGRTVRLLDPVPSNSGVVAQSWDGRDGNGDLVPPGSYIYSLTLEAEDREHRTGIVSVAY